MGGGEGVGTEVGWLVGTATVTGNTITAKFPPSTFGSDCMNCANDEVNDVAKLGDEMYEAIASGAVG